MSWMRDHFYYFVYPALIAARTRGNASSADVAKYFPANIPDFPQNKWTNLPPELRRLNALNESLLTDKFIQKVSVVYHNHWDDTPYSNNSRGKLHFDFIREALLSAESTRKALGCSKLLFAGRDVWAFEVMAQKRGIPSLFIPEISRKVAGSGNALRKLVDKYGFTGNELLVDTGFAGSIPRNMNSTLGCNLKFILLSQDKIARFLGPKDDRGHIQIGVPTTGHKEDLRAIERPNQIFPNRVNARGEALKTEHLPKYWTTGTIIYDMPEPNVIQYLAKPDEIIAAAFLTSNIWHGIKYGRNSDGSIITTKPKRERRVPIELKLKHSWL